MKEQVKIVSFIYILRSKRKYYIKIIKFELTKLILYKFKNESFRKIMRF